MIDELFVNDISLNLKENVPIPLNLSIADVMSPQKRTRNFSKQIDLPGTQTNMEVFSGTFSFTISENDITFDATQKAPANYKKRGVSVLKNPILKLESVIVKDGEVDVFRCKLFSESVDYFLLLSTILVGELPWDEYDHVLSRQNIKDSFVAPAGSGYYYPLIERGIPRLGTTIWRTTDLIPYVYEREVLIKMFEWAEVPIDTTYIDTDAFKSRLWGYGGGVINTLPPSEQAKRTVDIDNGNYSVNNLPPTYYPVPTGNERTFSWLQPFNLFDDSNFTYTLTSDVLGQYDNGEFTVQFSGNYNLSISIVLDIQFNIGTYNFVSGGGSRIFVYKNGQSIYTIASTNSIIFSPSGTITFDLNTSKALSLQSGDIISFGFQGGTCKVQDPTQIFSTIVDLDVSTNGAITIDFVSTDTAITDGGTVVLSNYLPQMKCSDFLVGSLRHSNFYLSDPDVNGVVSILPLPQYYLPADQAEDWTELVDHAKDIDIKPTANDYAKRILFQFKQSKDYDYEQYFEKWQERYGDYHYEQSSYYAKGELKISLPWGTIVPYEISPGILVPRFISINENGVASPNKGPSRLMLRNGQKSGFWTLSNANDITQFEYLTEYPCVHHFDDWEDPEFDTSFKLVEELFYIATAWTTVNSYSEFYFELINEMTSPAGKLFTLYSKLNPQIVKDPKFNALKKINGALYRLNKIIEFDDNLQETTKTELIRVLKAKSPGRKKIFTPAIPPTIGIGTIISPLGNGDDTGVIIGGSNSANSNSPIIFG